MTVFQRTHTRANPLPGSIGPVTCRPLLWAPRSLDQMYHDAGGLPASTYINIILFQVPQVYTLFTLYLSLL